MQVKYIIFFLAIVGMLIWTMPQTNSIFVGQHSFYNNDSGMGQVAPCIKCHQDIQTSMDVGNPPQEHTTLGCRGCHTRDGTTAHAASIKFCTDCHGYEHNIQPTYACTNCHGSHAVIEPSNPHENMGNLTCIDCHNMHL